MYEDRRFRRLVKIGCREHAEREKGHASCERGTDTFAGSDDMRESAKFSKRIASSYHERHYNFLWQGKHKARAQGFRDIWPSHPIGRHRILLRRVIAGDGTTVKRRSC